MNIFNTSTNELPYSCYLLREVDLPKFIALQDQVIGSLADNQKHRLKPRVIEDLKAHLKADMPIIGIKDNYDNHIAHLLLTTDTSSPATINLDGYPISEGIGVIQSVVIHPDHRQKQYNHLNEAVKPHDILFKQAKMMANEAGIHQIVAKVGAQNTGSKALFENQGFTTGKATILEGDDYPSVFFSLLVKPPKPIPVVKITSTSIAPSTQMPVSLALQ